MSKEERNGRIRREVEVFNSLMPQEASMAYTILENAGITARVEDNLPGYGLGASLMVWEEDAERATKELIEAGYIVDPEISDSKMEHDLANERKSHNRKMWTTVVLILLILIVLAIYSHFVAGVNG